MDNTRQFIAAILSLLLLLAYIMIFVWVCIYHREPSMTIRLFGIEVATEPLAYIWTSVSVLVGGIVAVAFGVPPPRPVRSIPPSTIINIYAVVYFLVGIVAAVVWLTVGPKTNLLIINAATTFIGLAVPIVSAFLRQGQQQARVPPGADV